MTETTANLLDLNSCVEMLDARFILVADRAYGKHKRFDEYLEKQQYFVILLHDNTTFHEPIPKERKHPFTKTLEKCKLGKNKALSQNRFRIVMLEYLKGNLVILVTNLHCHSTEKIAEIYKQQWQTEVFFRWIKQHLNIALLFGMTPNAVYG